MDLPVPVIQIVYDANGRYDQYATWHNVSDADMVARATLGEEGSKVFDPNKSADLVGVAWVDKNRSLQAARVPNSPFENQNDPGFAVGEETDIQKVVFNSGQLSDEGHATHVADPEANSGYVGGTGPESARRAYWLALRYANGVLNGTTPDPTHGATYYADAYLTPNGNGTYGPGTTPYSDDRTRFRNQVWGQGFTIPELQVQYGSP